MKKCLNNLADYIQTVRRTSGAQTACTTAHNVLTTACARRLLVTASARMDGKVRGGWPRHANFLPL